MIRLARGATLALAICVAGCTTPIHPTLYDIEPGALLRSRGYDLWQARWVYMGDTHGEAAMMRNPRSVGVACIADQRTVLIDATIRGYRVTDTLAASEERAVAAKPCDAAKPFDFASATSNTSDEDYAATMAAVLWATKAASVPGVTINWDRPPAPTELERFVLRGTLLSIHASSASIELKYGLDVVLDDDLIVAVVTLKDHHAVRIDFRHDRVNRIEV